MQLKQEANTEPRKRFHLLARLRKAAKHSEKLEKLCESPCVDAKTKLEAQVSCSDLSPYVYRKKKHERSSTGVTVVIAGLHCVPDWDGGF